MRAISPVPGWTRQSTQWRVPRHTACPQKVVNSRPAAGRRSLAAAVSISAWPAVVLWSVRKTKSRPTRRAIASRSATERPSASEWTVWVCRSPRYQPGPREAAAFLSPNPPARVSPNPPARVSPNPPAPFPGREGGETLPSPRRGGAGGEVLPSPRRGGAGGEVLPSPRRGGAGGEVFSPAIAAARTTSSP